MWKWVLQFRHHWKVQFPYLVGCTGRRERQKELESLTVNKSRSQVEIWSLMFEGSVLMRNSYLKRTFTLLKISDFTPLQHNHQKSHVYLG